MNFRPELAERVMAGKKTVTRRVPSDNPRSPWYRKRCGLRVGQSYAVCPGRGKNAVGRVVVRSVTMRRLGDLSQDEAQREGFETAGLFVAAWRKINGEYDPRSLVWRVEFEVCRAGSEA